MLVVFCIDKLSEFPSPYGPAILWDITFITVLLLAGLRLFFRSKEQLLSNPIHG